MSEFLASSDIIDFTHSVVAKKARELAKECNNDTESIKRSFEFVRDEIRHTGDGMVLCQK